MDRRSGLGWLQSWPAIALLLLTLLGVYRRNAPLENGRPIAERDGAKAESQKDGSLSSVNLKLWQDPFDALTSTPSGPQAPDNSKPASSPTNNSTPDSTIKPESNAKPDSPAKPDESKDKNEAPVDPNFLSIATRILNPYRERPPRPAVTNQDNAKLAPVGSRPPAYNAATQIFFIPLDDERAPEVREVRFRRRQAVIAALRASGMVAESDGSMGVLSVTKWATEPANPRSTKTTKSSAQVAYEWFSIDPLLPDSQRRTTTCQCLIVWIPSSAFADQLLNGIDQLMVQLDSTNKRLPTQPPAATNSELLKQLTDNQLRITLLGPESSTSLDQMLRWTYRKQVRGTQNSSTDQKQLQQPFLTWLNILSPAATYDTVLTLDELRRAPREQFKANPPAEKPANQSDDKPIQEPTEKTAQNPAPQPTDQSDRNKAILRDEEALFSQADISFQRSIGQDSVLASRLIRELELRGINLIPKVVSNSQGKPILDFDNLDEIALVTESNSLYGRAFPVIFAAAMLNQGQVDHTSEMKQRIESFLRDQQAPKNLRNYSYIRQIDGSRPVGLSTSKTTSKSAPQINLDGYGPYPEAPLGDGQLDYIRRLALQLKVEYSNRGVGQRRLKAIGIIGSDVYDKLLILQALRQVFPNVVFFTTDLDARLYQSENIHWTRNLLVASHYGLSLSNEYQRGILEADTPAFRDSYQTSYFFTLRYLLGLPFPDRQIIAGNEPHAAAEPTNYWQTEDLQTLATRSRIFEIGREQAIDLTDDQMEVTRSTQLHPSRHQSSWRESLWQLTLYSLAGFSTGILCYYTLANPRSVTLFERPANSRRRRLTRHAWWILLAILLAIVFSGLVLWDNYRPDGEPWSLSSGTSVWPCLALRLIALYLSAFFSWRILRPSRYLTLSGFMLQELNPRLPKSLPNQQQMSPTSIPTKTLFGAYLRLMLLHARELILGPSTGADNKNTAIGNDQVDVRKCWRHYQRGKHLGLMVFRAAMMTILMGLAHKALSRYSDEPHQSYRGAVNSYSFAILTYASDIAVTFLAFLIIDATRQACILVRNITSGTSKWPDDITRSYSQDKNLKEAVAEVLDVRFIAALTEEVGRQVYLPFIALMLVVVARLGLFDAPSWTLPLIVTYAIVVLSVPACTYILRRAAARGRDSSLQELRRELETKRSGKDTGESITSLIKEVEENKRGAFSPPLDDPFFGALLLPSGGFTIASFIETWLVG